MNKKIRILRQQDEAPKTYLFLALQAGKKKKKKVITGKKVLFGLSL